jgi:hypothetical protein
LVDCDRAVSAERRFSAAMIITTKPASTTALITASTTVNCAVIERLTG